MTHPNAALIRRFLNPRIFELFRYSSSKAASEPKIPDNSKCINKVILLGRCIAPANLKPLNNSHFTTFVMATNEIRRTKSNELVKRSDFHKVFIYQPFLAKKASDLITKGTRVYLEGKLNYRKYDDQFFSNIIAEKLIFISGTNQNYEIENDIIEEIDEAFVNETSDQKVMVEKN